MKKYYAIGFFILIIGLFAYHFYAASNAETNLDTSIQEITTKLDPQLSVSYSKINVIPFSGDIHFTDLNIIRNKDIRRARSVQFDFSYFDFLNISLFGPEYGLKKISSGNISLRHVSLTDRESLTEVKLDSFEVNYQGDLWELLAMSFKDSTISNTSDHRFDAAGRQFTFSQPEMLGIVKADSILLSNKFTNVSGVSIDSLIGSASLVDITWNPPKYIQDKYRFFIQGFGYQTDSIPFRKASSDYNYESETSLLSIRKLNLQSELFTGSFSGDIKIDSDTFSESAIEEASIQIGNLSPQLENFLSNAEKLFGVKIPMTGNQLTISVSGTVQKPQVKLLDK